MTVSEIKKTIKDGGIDKTLQEGLAVPEKNIEAERARYIKAADEFLALYGDGDVSVYSVGGRTEVSGNHTDHNYGRVIAASVNLDIIAFVKKRDDGIISLTSEGFDPDYVTPDAIESPDKKTMFHSPSLIAGMEHAFRDAGYNIGGFDAYTTSSVLKGSGISSSAAFEVMVGNILNYLYNDGKVSNVEIAKMAQFSENVFFGKPCGLMDQTACAVGGFITIDFCDPKSPVIEKIDFDLTKAGYNLCIVNTGGNHSDLNDDYASIPAEMKSVARELGATVLREITAEKLKKALAERGEELREKLGDRAILRAFHFLSENERVDAQVKALRSGNVDGFMKGVVESGNSSFKYLQNVYTTKNVAEQGLSLALCLTEDYLRGTRGVCRVHGGGFAGTIQAFVPTELTEEYARMIDGVFGDGACHILSIRKNGACRII